MYKTELHCHSTYSDGTYTPKELITLCNKNNVRVLSLTDHDTTEGVDETIIFGNRCNIKVIPGIELSTLENNESIHLLGYFKDESYKEPSLQNYLKELKDFRIYRAKEICKKLKIHFNIEIDYNNLIHNNVVARPHIAKEIINSGYDFSHDYIFENIINEESPAYVANKKISTKEGIQLLKSYNAVVSLAHPILIKKSSLEHIISLGVDGLEGIYPKNSPEDEFKFINIAKAHDLAITGGSDFHGIANDNSHGLIGQYSLTPTQFDNFIKKLG